MNAQIINRPVDVVGLKFEGGLQINTKIQIALNDEKPDWVYCQIDPETGIIQLQPENLWGGVSTRKDINENRRLVRLFKKTIQIPQQEGLFVLATQRDRENRYRKLQPVFHGNTYIFQPPPFAVMAGGRSLGLQAFEGAGPFVVYTANKAQSEDRGSNRVDVWTGERNGLIRTQQLVTQTYDDGKTFRDIPELHGEWTVYRLDRLRPYEPTANADVFNNAKVRELAEQLIFIPSDGFPGFDQKAEMLLVPAFQEYLRSNLRNFKVWRSEERNRDHNFAEAVTFRNARQGVVKFFDKTRAGGLGIIDRLNSDGELVSYQFGIRSFTADAELDVYGLPDMRRGDHVTWADEYDMTDEPKLKLPLVKGMEVVHKTTL